MRVLTQALSFLLRREFFCGSGSIDKGVPEWQSCILRELHTEQT